MRRDRVAAVGGPVAAAVGRDLAELGLHVELLTKHRRRSARVGRRKGWRAELAARRDAVHRQPVERHLLQRLAVVDTRDAERREVPLLGEHERLARRRRARGELLGEDGEQALGVGDAAGVAVAVAGVAGEHAAALRQLRRPVAQARIAGDAVGVDRRQAGVATDREQQAARRRRRVGGLQQIGAGRRRERAVVVVVGVDRGDPAARAVDEVQRVVRRPRLVDPRPDVRGAQHRLHGGADRAGAVGDEVIARDAGAVDRQHAAGGDVAVDLRADLGRRLDEAPEPDVGQRQGAGQPGLGIEVPVRIVAQDQPAAQRARQRRVVATGGHRVGLLALVGDADEIGDAALRQQIVTADEHDVAQRRQLRAQPVDDLADRADDVVRRARVARSGIPCLQRRADARAVRRVRLDGDDGTAHAVGRRERRQLVGERRARAGVGGLGALPVPEDERLRRRRDVRRERAERARPEACAGSHAIRLVRGRRDRDADRVRLVGDVAVGRCHGRQEVAAGVAALDEERHALVLRLGAVGDAAQRQRGERRGAHRHPAGRIGRRRPLVAVEVDGLIGQRRVGAHRRRPGAPAARRNGDPRLRALHEEVLVGGQVRQRDGDDRARRRRRDAVGVHVAGGRDVAGVQRVGRQHGGRARVAGRIAVVDDVIRRGLARHRRPDLGDHRRRDLVRAQAGRRLAVERHAAEDRGGRAESVAHLRQRHAGSALAHPRERQGVAGDDGIVEGALRSHLNRPRAGHVADARRVHDDREPFDPGRPADLVAPGNERSAEREAVAVCRRAMDERVERRSLLGRQLGRRGDPGQQLLQRVELVDAGRRARGREQVAEHDVGEGRRIGFLLVGQRDVAVCRAADRVVDLLLADLAQRRRREIDGLQRDLAQRSAQVAAAHDLVGERDRHAVPVAAQVRPQKLEIERVRLGRVDAAGATARGRSEPLEILTPRDARRGRGERVERPAEQQQRRDARAAQDAARGVEIAEAHVRRRITEVEHVAERDRLQRRSAQRRRLQRGPPAARAAQRGLRQRRTAQRRATQRRATQRRATQRRATQGRSPQRRPAQRRSAQRRRGDRAADLVLRRAVGVRTCRLAERDRAAARVDLTRHGLCQHAAHQVLIGELDRVQPGALTGDDDGVPAGLRREVHRARFLSAGERVALGEDGLAQHVPGRPDMHEHCAEGADDDVGQRVRRAVGVDRDLVEARGLIGARRVVDHVAAGAEALALVARRAEAHEERRAGRTLPAGDRDVAGRADDEINSGLRRGRDAERGGIRIAGGIDGRKTRRPEGPVRVAEVVEREDVQPVRNAVGAGEVADAGEDGTPVAAQFHRPQRAAAGRERTLQDAVAGPRRIERRRSRHDRVVCPRVDPRNRPRAARHPAAGLYHLRRDEQRAVAREAGRDRHRRRVAAERDVDRLVRERAFRLAGARRVDDPDVHHARGLVRPGRCGELTPAARPGRRVGKPCVEHGHARTGRGRRQLEPAAGEHVRRFAEAVQRRQRRAGSVHAAVVGDASDPARHLRRVAARPDAGACVPATAVRRVERVDRRGAGGRGERQREQQSATERTAVATAASRPTTVTHRIRQQNPVPWLRSLPSPGGSLPSADAPR